MLCYGLFLLSLNNFVNCHTSSAGISGNLQIPVILRPRNCSLQWRCRKQSRAPDMKWPVPGSRRNRRNRNKTKSKTKTTCKTKTKTKNSIHSSISTEWLFICWNPSYIGQAASIGLIPLLFQEVLHGFFKVPCIGLVEVGSLGQEVRVDYDPECNVHKYILYVCQWKKLFLA